MPFEMRDSRLACLCGLFAERMARCEWQWRTRVRNARTVLSLRIITYLGEAE